MLSRKKRNGKISVFRIAMLVGFFLIFDARSDVMEAQPSWRRPDCPRRAVFEVPPNTGSTLLLELPRDFSRDDPARAAIGPLGRTLGVSKMIDDGTRAWFLVQRDTSNTNAPYAVYFGQGSDSLAASPPRDLNPVRLEVYRPTGGNAPNTWPRMHYMLHHASLLERPLPMPSLDAVGKIFRSGRWVSPEQPEARRNPPLLLCRSSVWAIFSQEEKVRFALGSNSAAFLLVDGRVVAEEPYGTSSNEWSIGDAILIPAGVRLIELILATRGPPDVRVGWLRSDMSDPEPFPPGLLVSATLVRGARLERIDQVLTADFAFTRETAYGFRRHPAVFVPVRFHNRSVSRSARISATHWQFDDGRFKEGDVVRHIFTGEGVRRTRLEVRDELGFTDAVERELDLSNLVPTLYALHAELEGLPAAAFSRDRFNPRLVVRGGGPPDAVFETEWILEQRDGTRLSGTSTIRTEQLPLQIHTGSFDAAKVECLRWRVRHEGTELFAETIRFGPASTVALRVEADAIREAGGQRHVFIAEERPRSPPFPRLTLDDIFGQLVCVDDTLAPYGSPRSEQKWEWHRRLARLLDGPDRPEVRLLHPPRSDHFPEAWAPLLKLTVSPEAVTRRPTLIVVSLALGDLLAGLDVETFERHAAVMTDRLLRTAPVVWLTPPPLPDLGDRARAYAAAIQRVARSRGLPVADLFTSFIGAGAMENPQRFFLPSTVHLTSEGRELAAETTARALLQAAGESP